MKIISKDVALFASCRFFQNPGVNFLDDVKVGLSVGCFVKTVGSAIYSLKNLKTLSAQILV
ncbi:hypothetical protein AKJ43_02015 [candidate division MSBL1 archaeon SCGC-AAA261D19]|uniref:Uncharacterized protein n=1 Tax=candidate division MSBL1 archaeon SCGC-AAA261D19 TaxID=1698273 RepID=A0A133V794_9EURY|nr:hypothetical protein AKJ43_02015 [candidate division MSBL1 archaeon SCGC-AAA261D19]